MTDTPLPAQISRSLDPVIAQGLNDAAAIILQHVRDAVPYRTGSLSESYAITKRAVPGSLSVAIESALPYRLNFYPFTESFGRKPRLGGDARPLLFAPEGASQAGEEVVKESISQAIEERFDG